MAEQSGGAHHIHHALHKSRKNGTELLRLLSLVLQKWVFGYPSNGVLIVIFITDLV